MGRRGLDRTPRRARRPSKRCKLPSIVGSARDADALSGGSAYYRSARERGHSAERTAERGASLEALALAVLGARPADTAAPKLALLSKRLRVKGGRAAVRISCPASETACTGTAKLLRNGKVVGKARIDIAGGETRTLRIQLTRKTRIALTKAPGNKLRVTLKLTVADPAAPGHPGAAPRASRCCAAPRRDGTTALASARPPPAARRARRSPSARSSGSRCECLGRSDCTQHSERRCRDLPPVTVRDLWSSISSGGSRGITARDSIRLSVRLAGSSRGWRG